MKVLGIDPGYGRCGVAVLERTDGTDTLLYSECIETSSELPFEERLAIVAAACSQLIQTHAPEHIALEKLFFGKNRTTGMRVAEVRGAILALAGAAGIAVAEYAPNEVKSATTGYGSADKKQVAKMIHALVKIGKVIRHDDEYDAIAIGITHLACARARALVSPRGERR